MKKILPLKKGVKYTLEDIPKIYTVHDNSGGAHYNINVTLSYKVGESKRLFSLFKPGINLQFAMNLHIGAEWLDDKEFIPKHWQELTITSDRFKKPESNTVSDINILSDKFLCSYISESSGEEKKLPKRLNVFRCDPPIEINGNQIQFIVIPSFEIARFFYFNSNSYNELLLKSDFSGAANKNLIFNPKRSCTFTNKDKQVVRHVQLRKGVDDSSAYHAANLAFNPGFQGQMKFLKGIVEGSGSLKNYCSFFGMKLPVNQFKNLRVLGDFVEDKAGNKGFRINVIIDAENNSNELYTFGRDNDSRSIHECREELPIQKSRIKKTPKSKKLTKSQINHKESADPDFDDTSLEVESEFSKYNLKGKARKLKKVDQDVRAQIVVEITNKKKKGSAGKGQEGGLGSSYEGVDNSLNVDGIITYKEYWDNFSSVIKNIRKQWKGIEIEYWDSKRQMFVSSKEPLSCIVDLRSFIVEAYFIKLSINDKFAYIFEFNQTEVGKNTIIFQKSNASSIEITDIKYILKYIRKGKTKKKLVKKLSLRVKGVVHRMYTTKSKNGGESKPLKTNEAISQFSSRVVNYLLPMLKS